MSQAGTSSFEDGVYAAHAYLLRMADAEIRAAYRGREEKAKNDAEVLRAAASRKLKGLLDR